MQNSCLILHQHLNVMSFLDVVPKFVSPVISIPAKFATVLRFFAALQPQVSLQVPFGVVGFQTVGTTVYLRLDYLEVFF